MECGVGSAGRYPANLLSVVSSLYLAIARRLNLYSLRSKRIESNHSIKEVLLSMGDILFGKIESWQGGSPWGKFLDAGTGVHSLKWIQNLNTESWCAVTADHGMKRSCESAGVNIRPCDSIVVGNWMDEEFCDSLGKYDTILADYLIGAVDGFSPYKQDLILHR